MGSSVRRSDGHGRILAGRWLPLSIFNLDYELGYEPDLLDGLQVRKRGLTDALAEEGVLTLQPELQDLIDALFWQRATVRQAGRQLNGAQLPQRPSTLAELLWEQWRDDPAGTEMYLRERMPGWREPPRPPPRPREWADYGNNVAVRRLRAAALDQLRAWCEKWVANELDGALEEASRHAHHPEVPPRQPQQGLPHPERK